MFALSHLRICLILAVAILLTPVFGLSQSTSGPPNQADYQSTEDFIGFSDYGLADFVSLRNGKEVFLLSGWRGPCELKFVRQPFRQIELKSMYEKDSLPRYCTNIFADKNNPNAFLVLGHTDYERKNGVSLFRCSSNEVKLVSHISERFRRPSYLQASDGSIIMASRSGVVYRVSDQPRQQPLRYSILPPEGMKFEPNRLFREIKFAPWNDGTVCCYSIADAKYNQQALYDVLVSRPTGWKSIALGVRATGPACMTAADKFVMVRYDRFIHVDLKTEKVTEQPFEIPSLEGAKLKPVHLIRLPDGTLLSLWRKLFRSYMAYDVEPFADGSFHQIAIWKNGRWEFERGKDRQLYQTQQHLIDQGNNLWMSTCEGTLLRRSPDGKYREFDFRHGVCMDGIETLRLCPDGKRAWAINPKNGNACMVNFQNLNDKPVDPPSNWTVIYSRKGAGLIYDGKVKPTVTLDGRVYTFDKPDLDSIAMPPRSLFDPASRNNWIVNQDTRDHLWITAYPTAEVNQMLVVWYDGEQWHKFERRSQGDEMLSPLEAAAEAMLEKDYRRGDSFLEGRVAFGPDSTIALVNGSRKGVSIFDGKRWHLAKTDLDGRPGAEFKRYVTKVSFEGDTIVAHSRGQKMALSREAWETALSADSNARPWKEWLNPAPATSPPRRISYRERRDKQNRIFNLLKTPGRIWTDSFSDLLFAGGYDWMAIYANSSWMQFSSKASPMRLNRNVRRFGFDQMGRLIVEVDSPWIQKVFVYSPMPIKVTPKQVELGSLESTESMLAPQWTTDRELDQVRIRYRIDSSPWSDWIEVGESIKPGPITPPGKHYLELQLRSQTELIRCQPMRYSFDVTYNMEDQIKKWVRQLAAMNSEDRDEATANLKKLGRLIRDSLEKHLAEAKDAETRSRLRQILSEGDDN